MAQYWAESTWEPISYGSFMNQFQLDIITSISQIENINTKICRQKKMSVLFNQICINEDMLLKHTHTKF